MTQYQTDKKPSGTQKTIYSFVSSFLLIWPFQKLKEPSQWDGLFERPKHMLKLMGKEIFTLLRSKILFI